MIMFLLNSVTLKLKKTDFYISKELIDLTEEHIDQITVTDIFCPRTFACPRTSAWYPDNWPPREIAPG